MHLGDAWLRDQLAALQWEQIAAVTCLGELGHEWSGDQSLYASFVHGKQDSLPYDKH